MRIILKGKLRGPLPQLFMQKLQMLVQSQI